MAPPPSQAGRFKPRKPAKKIRVGSAAATAAATTTTPSSPAAPSASTSSSNAGRGRGRGGRGSRAPMPHGAVFFTGNAPPTLSTRTTTRSAAGAPPTSTRGNSAPAEKSVKGSIVKAERRAESNQEIVVGELDVAIGASEKAVQPKEEPDEESAHGQVDNAEYEREQKPRRFEVLADTYDSDSSEEEQRSANRFPDMSLPPTELPFPVSSLPIGIGGHERSVLYDCLKPEESKKDRDEPLVMDMQTDPPLVSPFVDWNDAKLQKEEEDSWFIFQFPTRLPALKSHGGPEPVPSGDTLTAPVAPSSLTPDTSLSMTPDVVTPSTITTNFDNTLSKAPAGRLGRVVVHKSGKTVLVMGGDGGSPEIRMNVTEGLPCGFVQQAVAIDQEESNYIPLGEVKKTVVVTPDVDTAFSSP